MHIVDFELCHAAEAACLAQKHLEKERAAVDLPACELPDLASLANGLGVAAMDGGRLIGFLGAYGPFHGMFGTWGTVYQEQFVGVFSPVQAHGLAEDAPARTLQRMYQAAAEKWARAGAKHHAIALYEHETAAKAALFRYGFGQRCADAIRPVEGLNAAPVKGVTCRELPPNSGDAVRDMRQALDEHLCQSPCFLARTEEGRRAWLDAVKHRDSRLFAASAGGRLIAFMEVCADGENFLTEHVAMRSICGAYCEPAWRGKGVSRLLLDHVLGAMAREGVRYLGVDYESFNPTAAGFWEKYFVPYTASVVRRIDQ